MATAPQSTSQQNGQKKWGLTRRKNGVKKWGLTRLLWVKTQV
jgi:hypothetical protein